MSPRGDKIVICVEHSCYICAKTLSSASAVINHVDKIHGYRIPSRAVGSRRPAKDGYEVIQKKDAAGRSVDEYHYSCVSCWYHCPKDEEGVLDMNHHYKEEHHPVKIDISNNNEDTPSPRSPSVKNETSRTSTPERELPRLPATRSRLKNLDDNLDRRVEVRRQETPQEENERLRARNHLLEAERDDLAARLDRLEEQVRKLSLNMR